MKGLIVLGACLGLVGLGVAGQGQGVNALETVWVLVAAYPDFFMQAGVAMVATGVTRAKNAVNILPQEPHGLCRGHDYLLLGGIWGDVRAWQ